MHYIIQDGIGRRKEKMQEGLKTHAANKLQLHYRDHDFIHYSFDITVIIIIVIFRRIFVNDHAFVLPTQDLEHRFGSNRTYPHPSAASRPWNVF